MSAVFFFGAPTSVARIPFLLRVWWVGGGCRNFRSSFSAFLCKYISFIVIVSISWYSFPLLSRSDIVFLPLLWYVVHGLFLSLCPLPNEFLIVSHSHKRRVHIWFELYLIFIVWYGRSNHTHTNTHKRWSCIFCGHLLFVISHGCTHFYRRLLTNIISRDFLLLLVRSSSASFGSRGAFYCCCWRSLINSAFTTCCWFCVCVCVCLLWCSVSPRMTPA